MIYQSAIKFLAKSDPVMRRLMKQIGPCGLEPQRARQPFESLVRAIAHQQIHGKAAEAILGRFVALYPGKFPQPAALLETDSAALRGCGFSQAKVAAILDIAAHTLAGTVPTLARIRKMPDEKIVQRLIQIRGVGRWTVEMLLIFQLGRPDILPVDDFGIRNGFRIAYQCVAMPKPREVLEYGARWQPYRTVASWYLWRAADMEKAKPVQAVRKARNKKKR